MTQQDFITYTSVYPNRLSVWYSQTGPPYTIYGLSIPVLDLNKTDSSKYLQRVTGISIPLSGGSRDRINLQVESNLYKESLGVNYYILLTKPYQVSSLGNLLISAATVVLSPAFDIAFFEDSAYNVLGGSIKDARQSTILMQSDRYKVGTLSNPTYTGPLNIDQLLSGSATKASVQDSNYNSISWTRSRYNGTQTNRFDYNVDPALAGRLFQGADFASTVSNSQINFLTSSNQIEYRDLFYAGQGETPGFSVNSTTGFTFITNDNSSYSSTDKLLLIRKNTGINATNNINAGDLIANSTLPLDVEIMKVLDVNIVTGVSTLQYILEVERGYLSNPGSIASNTPMSKVTPVQIYNVEGNRLSGVSKNKVLVKETGKILGVDSLGYVVSTT